MTLGRLILVVLVSIVVVGVSCRPQVEDKSLARIREAGELVIGIDPSYPPFEAIDGQGQLVGYDVDLAEYISRRLGVRARFVGVDIGGIHDGLVAKKFDVIISSLPPFPELTRQISYSRPYFNAGQVLVVRQNDADISSFKDLGEKSIGVEGASSGDIEARKLVTQSKLSNTTVHPYQTPDAVMVALKAQEVDAAVVDAVTAMEFIKREKGIKIVGQPLTVEPYVVAVRNGEALLLKEIDNALMAINDDGTGDRLQQKWFGMDGSN